MPAGLFERSVGPGDAWEVADAWLEPHGGADEPHAGVARRRGAAVPRPVCGAPRGARDSRERTWRHLDVWQHGTIVRCAVPRADCPGHGARAVRTPWEARPSSHLVALFEAQAIAAVMSGATAEAVASRPREADGRIWAALRRAAAEARQAADHSGVARAGVDDTSRARRHTHVSVTANLDAGRVAAATDGRDRGAPARPCAQLEAHGGDAPATPEVARDMAAPCSLGCAGARPNASQAVDRLHVMRLAPREADRVRRAEAKSSAERGRLPRGTRCCRPKRPGNLTGRQAARKASLMSERPLAARACAMAEALRAACPMPDGESAARELDRWPGWVTHSNVPQMKRVAATVREEREGILNWLSRRSTNGIVEGMNSVIQPMKRAARGFRGLADFTAPILLRLGRLEFAATSATGCATH